MEGVDLPNHIRRITCISSGLVLFSSFAATVLVVSSLVRRGAGPQDVEAAVVPLFLFIIGAAIVFNVLGSAATLANLSWGPRILRFGLIVTALYALTFIVAVVLSDVAAGQPLAASFFLYQLLTCALHAALGAFALLFASFLRRHNVLRQQNTPSTA